MMKQPILLACLILVVMILAQNARAAEIGVVTTANVNLRAGPNTAYPVVTTVPAGARLVLHGCVASYDWCDISFGRERGWLASAYMSAIYRGAPVPLTGLWALRLGIDVVAFDAGYWRRYYLGRPWYRRWSYYRVW